MQLLPTIVIVSLLGFFVILTVICIVWHWRRSRILRKRRPSDNSYKTRSTRHLTVEGTKVVNVADTLEKGGLENEKGEEEKPYLAFANDAKRSISLPASIHSPRVRQASNGSRNAIYGGPQLKDIVKMKKKSSHTSSQEAADSSRSGSLHAERSGSLTLPRPALINIERRGSASSRKVKKARRQSHPPNTAQPWYGRTPSGMAVVVELPASPIFSEKASVHPDDQPPSPVPSLTLSGLSSRRASAPDLTSSISFFDSESSQHVTFAPTQDATSKFSSSTATPEDSSSSTVNPNKIKPRTAPTSTTQLSGYSTDRTDQFFTPRSANSPDSPHSPDSRDSPKLPESDGTPRLVSRLERPPNLDVDIPHVAPFSFFNASFSSPSSPQRRPVLHRRNRSAPITSPASPERPASRGLHRIPSVRSVMSSRSVLTIASSEISSNWTIGDAQAVDITPCIGPEEQAEGSASELEGDRLTPEYAKTLRSKYGRYPRGRRDKALPTIPRSPLSKSFGLGFDGLGGAGPTSQ